MSIAAAAIAIRFMVNSGPDSSAFAILLIGVLLAAWVGGVGPAIVAQTLILAAHGRYFSSPDAHHAPMFSLRAVANLSAFYGVGLTVAVLSDFARAARRRDRNSAAEAMAQRERLHALLSCMADGVISTDAAGRIATINPRAEALLDLSTARAIGKPLSDVLRLYDAASQEPVADPAGQAIRQRGTVHSKTPLLLQTGAGRSLPVSFSAAPIADAMSGLTGVVVAFRDESERRATEDALRTADRRKDEFLATLAHELRNPLAPICMGLELMKLSASNGIDQAETRAMVERQTRHMVRLIDDLLDVSRITRGKLELRRSAVRLQTAVNNVVEAARGTVQQAGHELFVNLPQQPVFLDADPDRLMQILSNLLNNAVKYTPRGGRISIDAVAEDRELTLTVADNGRGIEPDRLSTIFEMFNQSSAARESGHFGLGIGLTLTRRLAEMHGGTVEARSDGPGCGSAFVLRLPVMSCHPSAPAAAPATSRAASPAYKVLLVDDNHDALATMSTLVAVLGHEVRTAGDGLEALAAAEEFAPHAILMDLGMPRMNGYDAAREIRRTAWGKQVRLIAVTGWGQATDRLRTEAAGFDSHLVKPIDLAALRQALADIGRCSKASSNEGSATVCEPDRLSGQNEPAASPTRGLPREPVESQPVE
ncbi:MAG TPA: ATP-binding protein [Pirellulales bacterium]|nr:ATP-binding protein [Pirellulales bacterium]